MKPLVSLIIPTRNRASLLAQAIESLRRQSYTPIEIIVVDDGSSDNTAQVASSVDDTAQVASSADDTPEVVLSAGAGVRYLYQPHRGPAAARNLGIANARGEVLGFLDDDDLWMPNALEWGVNRLQDSAAPLDMVFGLTQRVSHAEWNGIELRFEPIPPVWAIMSFCNVLVRRAVMTRVGPLDETLEFGEDVDWFLRAREQRIPYGFLAQVTHLYRIHAANMTKDTGKVHHYFLRVLKQSVSRRTDAAGQVVVELPDLPYAEIAEKIRYNATSHE